MRDGPGCSYERPWTGNRFSAVNQKTKIANAKRESVQCQGPLSARPTSTGCMVVALQCQPPSFFSKANDFSTRRR